MRGKDHGYEGSEKRGPHKLKLLRRTPNLIAKVDIENQASGRVRWAVVVESLSWVTTMVLQSRHIVVTAEELGELLVGQHLFRRLQVLPRGCEEKKNPRE